MSNYPAPSALHYASIRDIHQRIDRGELTVLALTQAFLDRIEEIDRHGPTLRAVIEINPDALTIAAALDALPRQQRGPLFGIPILIKDNIDTGDRMQTTAGSLALVGAPALQDATVAARLRAAGAVILGKTNLSEWAGFRALKGLGGWSSRGGRTRNPHILDRSTSGSIAGSAAAVAAGLCTVALGSETDGSIISPSVACGVVGLKPTVGLTSRAGVIPISYTQDTVGVHSRNVADAAIVLGVLTGQDVRDPATAASQGREYSDYQQFLSQGALQGTRIGVPTKGGFWGYHPHADRIARAAIETMRRAGAIIVEGTELPTIDALEKGDSGQTVLYYEFLRDVNAYLATRRNLPVRTMADVVAWNHDHADVAMPYIGQERMELALAKLYSEEEYESAKVRGQRLAGLEGIDAAISNHGLDALVAPGAPPGWVADLLVGDPYIGRSTTPAAMAGYPMITVPAGFAMGMPFGIALIGKAWSEPRLLRLAHAFEIESHALRAPAFLPTLDESAREPVDSPPLAQYIAAVRAGEEIVPPTNRLLPYLEAIRAS